MSLPRCTVQFPLPLDKNLKPRRHILGRELELLAPDGSRIGGVRSITLKASFDGVVTATVELFVNVQNAPRP